jgi:uncharacterized protein involved in exopolysaccharide biosynthesis
MTPPASLPPRSKAEIDDDSEPVNVVHALDLAKYFLRAAGRRRLLTAVVLVFGALLTVSAARLAPRTYTVEAKVLSQHEVSNPLLGISPRAEPIDTLDAPARAARETRVASETVLRRDNLVAIVEETKLPERWDRGRSPIQKLFSALRRAGSTPESSEDRERSVLRVLEKRIGVKADETTITLSVAWHDPEIAHQIMSCMVRNFLRDRSSVETAAPTEAIRVLEEQTARQREAMDKALAAAEEAQRSAAKAEVNSRVRSSAENRAITADDTRITTELEDKRRAILAAEGARQHHLGELRAQLDRLRLTYTSEHPAVVAMEERIRNARAEPAELAALKRQEAAILARLKGIGPKGDTSDPIAALEQPKVAATRIKLVTAVNRYEELLGRLDAARIELDAAQAMFKHRYVVSEPPEVPKQPAKPIVLIVTLIGTLVTLAAAFLFAGLRELAQGRFIEPSQVRRKLSLPLLAEVDEP